MKKILFTLTVLVTSFLTACQADDLENMNPGNSNERGFSLSYHVNDAFSTLTRSSVSVEDGEDLLNSFYILFFESSTGATGAFLDAVEIESVKQTPLRSSGTLNITLPAELVNSKDYNILLLANVDKYSAFTTLANLKNECTGLTENDVIHTLLTVSGVTPGGDPIEEQENNTKAMPKDYLPMSANFVKKAGERNVTVELIRAVSRFDVVCEAEGYDLVSASVWNGLTSTPLLSSKFTDFKTAERTERYYGVYANNNKIVGSLYAFENYVSSPVQNDKKSTCLIIGLRKEGSQEVEYFRTNVNNIQNVGQQIKRNNAYRTTIKSVSNRGGRTEREAYENPDNFILYLELNPANVPAVSADGGTTEKIFVSINSNESWTAELSINEGSAGFNGDVNTKSISGGNGDSFTVTFEALSELRVNPHAVVTVKMDGKEEVNAILNIYQEPLPMGVLVCTNTIGVGSLVLAGTDYVTRAAENTKSNQSNYLRYVYGLGETLRNASLFGPEGSVVSMPATYQFVQQGFDYGLDHNFFEKAHIYQAISSLNNSGSTNNEITRLKALMAADDKKLLIISHTGNTYVSDNLTNMGFTDYATKSITSTGSLTRYFNTALNLSDPLVSYLVKKGPFTNGIQLDVSEISMSGKDTTISGLTAWSGTFIPLIMVTKDNTTYCVFGIDPANNLIFIGDPSIFGSNNSSDKNYQNYQNKAANTAFMQNFAAWLTNAALYGTDFVNDVN